MKTKKIPLLFYLFLLLIGVSSCYTPQEIVKLNPLSTKTSWLSGRAFLKDSVNGIIISTAFSRLERPYLVFDFEITNQSNLPYLVDPSEFYYIAQTDSAGCLNDTIITNALDPEDKVLDVEKEMSRNVARQKNGTIIGIAATGVAVATGVAAATTDDEGKQNRRALNSLGSAIIADAALSGASNAEINNYDLQYQLDQWEKSVLRKTTLNSGFTIRGKVFFPYNSKANFYKIIIPIDKDKMILLYNQHKYSAQRQQQ